MKKSNQVALSALFLASIASVQAEARDKKQADDSESITNTRHRKHRNDRDSLNENEDRNKSYQYYDVNAHGGLWRAFHPYHNAHTAKALAQSHPRSNGFGNTLRTAST